MACFRSISSWKNRYDVWSRPGTWVMNVLIMPPLLGPWKLCPVTILQRVGLVTALIPLPVLVLATTLVTSWKNCEALELKQHRYLKTGFSAVFLIGVSHELHECIAPHVVFSQPFSRVQPLQRLVVPYVPRKTQFRVFLPLRVVVKLSHATCGII